MVNNVFFYLNGACSNFVLSGFLEALVAQPQEIFIFFLDDPLGVV